jgi:diguanylate cyclase (GGDEF)-like protein/PAS domain S-box-containing protein
MRDVTSKSFSHQFNWLILLTWTVPPVIGLSFLLLIGMFTPGQIWRILTTPLEPAFILAWIGFSFGYFTRYARPIADSLHRAGNELPEIVNRRMRWFPLHYFGLFLGYLLMAPVSVIWSAQRYAGFTATPVDWFRIHLVALTVSIIVGLPIFFRILDLFGRTMSGRRLTRPHVKITMKVFLIGALIPLLIDTMIVQYYWTRTDYFTAETFAVWLSLEVLAILGSLMFVKSFGQSLQPLAFVVEKFPANLPNSHNSLSPGSTDELGVLATGYRGLLDNLQLHGDILRLGNRLLQTHGNEAAIGGVMNEILRLCRDNVGGDKVFLILHEPATDELVGVAQTGSPYRPEGHFRLSLQESSTAAWVFTHGEILIIKDALQDPRASTRLQARYHTRSALAAPLRIEGRPIGVLMSITVVEPREFSDSDIYLMQTLANEAALAVHTHLLQREKARSEAAARAREEQIHLLMDYSAEAVFALDLEGNCTFANPACCRMLGYAGEADLLGRNMHALMHHTRPDGSPYPVHDCQILRAAQTGQPTHADSEVNWRADGSRFPVEWWSHPVYRDGERIGAVVNFIDITERVQTESELQRLADYNRLLLESTGDGIFGVDDDLRCTFANRAACEMLGFSSAELIGQDMHALVQHSHEDGRPRAREENPFYRTLREGRYLWSESDVLWHAGREPFPVQYSCNALRRDGEISGAVVVFRNIAEARAMAQKMEYLATHDPLTGLVNRREFERRLGVAREEIATQARDGVLCYLDLDQFKVVNDTCGHVAGDELLRQLAAILHGRLRKSGTLARLGGDEFGVLFPDCGIRRATNIAHELLGEIQNFRFAWENKTFSVGASIGIVALTKDFMDSAGALSAADAACYIAKDAGRNRVHIYEEDDKELTQRKGEMQWVSRIRDALDRQQFVLVGQLIKPVSADCHASSAGLEVLVRMRGEDGSIILPGAFLPAAERYNLILALDRWVMMETLQHLGRHADQLDALEFCTLNLSGSSLGDEQFLAFLVDQLVRNRVPAAKLCFEITESAAIANLSKAIHFITVLKEYGCRFALDDFGSGMSSFTYLKNLPVDFLKIDGNFIRDMARDPIDRAMVAAIHQVGNVMGIRTIAEFVENEEILAALREIGVNYAQGFGISRPEPLEDILHANAASIAVNSSRAV